MSWLEAIVLGIVQGLTEFLPISSSAHLSIVGQLFFSGHDPGAAFTAVTQLGTETAVLIYFAKDIGRIISRWCQALVGCVPQSDPDVRMGWLVIIGSVPIAVLGLLFQDAIDTQLRNLWITVAMLAGVGLLLLAADRFARGNSRPLEKLTWPHGVIFGLAQSAALIPGVSRSGATISGGLFMGYTREASARYAFLLAVPAVFASGLYKLRDVAADGHIDWPQVAVATLIAFAIGYAVIAWLLRYISTHDFRPFVYYRLALAGIVGILIGVGVLNPMGA